MLQGANVWGGSKSFPRCGTLFGQFLCSLVSVPLAVCQQSLACQHLSSPVVSPQMILPEAERDMVGQVGREQAA